MACRSTWPRIPRSLRRKGRVSQFRYMALIWDREIESQCACARVLTSQLRTSMLCPWTVGLTKSGISVFHTGGHPSAVACYRLPGESGVVLGTVFLRGVTASGDTSSSLIFACEAAQAELILSSGGRWLVEKCWGRYVALLCEPDGKTFRVLRDPSGTLSCLITTFEGLTVVFSHPADVIGLGVLEPSVNWRYIAAHVSQPQLNGRETALNEILEVCAGECFSWRSGRTSRAFLWHPARFAKNGSGAEEPDKWVDGVYSTVRGCVHSWASRHRSILHRLSGGLDSSVVLACLRSAPDRPSFTAVNCFSHDSVGDERSYARAAASHAHCPLVELSIEPDFDLRRILTIERSARPAHYFAGLQTGPHETRLAKELQATAIFGGGWGDQLFYRTRNDAAATDYIATHGWSGNG